MTPRERAKALAHAWTNGRKPVGHLIDDIEAALLAAERAAYERAAQRLEQRALGWQGSEGIFNGTIIADELRWHAKAIRALASSGDGKEG